MRIAPLKKALSIGFQNCTPNYKALAEGGEQQTGGA
jgi:hypothetical protein